MSYHGIDYGHGTTNVDRATGIRFGVISMHDLEEWASEGFEPQYGNASCPYCGNEAAASDEGEGDRDDYEEIHRGREFACDSCRVKFDGQDAFPEEPHGYTLDGEYKAEWHNDGDVFVLSSPYYTHAAFCSPCAPGACHLSSPHEGGERCYCFGHDWFEGNKAPYPVFRVSDGSPVAPE
jgi:hypothetical protein